MEKVCSVLFCYNKIDPFNGARTDEIHGENNLVGTLDRMEVEETNHTNPDGAHSFSIEILCKPLDLAELPFLESAMAHCASSVKKKRWESRWEGEGCCSRLTTLVRASDHFNFYLSALFCYHTGFNHNKGQKNHN